MKMVSLKLFALELFSISNARCKYSRYLFWPAQIFVSGKCKNMSHVAVCLVYIRSMLETIGLGFYEHADFQELSFN